LNRLQRQKQPAMTARVQQREAKLLIEATCLLVYGIDDYGINGDLVADCQRALNGIDQQHSAHTMATGLLIDSKPTQQCRRDRMSRQLAGDTVRQLIEFNRKRGQCVIAHDGVWIRWCRRNKYATDAALHILAGLLVKIIIKRRHAAVKAGSLVAAVQRRDEQRRIVSHLLVTRCSCSLRAAASLLLSRTGLTRALKNASESWRFRRMT